MSTPEQPLNELKTTQDRQAKEIKELKEQITARLPTIDFGKKWQEKKDAADAQAKKDNNQLFDEYEGFQSTALTGQKSEANWAKEEINGLNAAVNTLEASWSIAKLELKPLFSFRFNDRINEAIGKLQDRLGLYNPEGEAERRLLGMESGIQGLKTRATRLETGVGRLQDQTVSAHTKIRETNTRINGLERRAADTRQNVTSGDRTARTASTGSLTGTSADIRQLEIRVQALVQALG